MKFGILEFFENKSRKFKLQENLAIITYFTWRPIYGTCVLHAE